MVVLGGRGCFCGDVGRKGYLLWWLGEEGSMSCGGVRRKSFFFYRGGGVGKSNLGW